MKFSTDIIIGLEAHVELKTASKLFCSCPRLGSDNPNSRTCPICLGHPGSKPVLNKKALEFAIKLGLATNSKLADQLIFSRKSYFYPDLAKNYQITQYELPLAQNGFILLSTGKKINLTRIHLEEDPASLVHQGNIAESSYCLIDYNRSGNPLVEIVSEPEMESPEEARDFLKKLRTLLIYLDIYDPNKCIIKADANISIKETDYKKVEIKNITGFKGIEKALFYEVSRQKNSPSSVIHETRGFDSVKTYPMRKKETEEDYGYIIDPDLVPVLINKNYINEIEKTMPELPEQVINKFVKKYKIKKEDALVLAEDKKISNLFEMVAKKVDPILAAKWIRRELVRVLNYNEKILSEVEITPKHLIDLFNLIHEKKITETTGQKIIEKLILKPFDINEYVKKESLSSISDSSELEKYCLEAIKENPKAAEDYKMGEEKSLNFIIGQVMKKTRGKATPKEVNEILKRLI